MSETSLLFNSLHNQAILHFCERFFVILSPSELVAIYRKRYMLSVSETARLFGVSDELIYNAVKRNDGSIEVFLIGKRILILRSAVFATLGLD